MQSAKTTYHQIQHKHFEKYLYIYYTSFLFKCQFERRIFLWKEEIELQGPLVMENGTLYYSKALECWIYQYFDKNGIRKSMKQRKKELARDFKARVTKFKNDRNNGTYIEKSKETIRNIGENFINQKFNDGTIKEASYMRNQETLAQLEKCFGDIINKPIQKVTLSDIQTAKEFMKKEYSQSCIDKMWGLLNSVFATAASPSHMLIPFNIMLDVNLKKPISEKKFRKVYPLTREERERLNHVLDNEERNHKYRNIVKMEWLTGMRIGEVLARSKKDIADDKSSFHIHNTLTKDIKGNIILSKHTKTYDKKSGIDKGKRYFPMFKELEDIIQEQLDAKVLNIYGLLFWDYKDNTFINPNEVNSWIARINKKYNISNKSLHNHRLRHDRATLWKESGMDMAAIQYLVGHIEGSDITEEYVDVSKDFAFEQFEKIS